MVQLNNVVMLVSTVLSVIDLSSESCLDMDLSSESCPVVLLLAESRWNSSVPVLLDPREG